MLTADTLSPITFGSCDDNPKTRAVITQLINGNISCRELFECDRELFARIQGEAMKIVREEDGQAVDADHPTYKFVSTQDPDWKPRPDSLGQWSLFNSKDDFSFSGEDHHWHHTDRKFNSKLSAIPQFFDRYFKGAEIQNCRLNLVTAGGTLGLHREKIIGIPHREDHFKLRFHMPIVTNPGVEFVMDTKKFKMREGVVYAFNQGCLHGVSNQGEALRVHMIFDLYLNDAVIDLLDKAA